MKIISIPKRKLFNTGQRCNNPVITISAFVLLCIMSCSKEVSQPDDSFTPIFGEPLIKATGEPQGDLFSTPIGPEGGVISYGVHPNIKVRMEIPPAAVDEATIFTIQPISNTHDDTSEKFAFRFGPENINFNKPIKVSFLYDSEMEGIANTRMVAFQRNDGVWCGVSTALNEADRMLTIETSHFSDWVWFDFVSLRKNIETVSNGGQVELRLMEQILGALNPTNHIDNLPLGAMDEIGLSRDLTVSNWRIIHGPGTLEPKINTHALNGNAIYTAPETVNQFEEVEIQVEVDSRNGYIRDPNAPNGQRKFGKLIMVTKIQLTPESLLSLRLNGVDQNLLHSGQGYVLDGSIYIRATNEQETKSVTLICEGGDPGEYPGGDGPGQSQFLYVMEQGGLPSFLNNYYRDCNNEFVFNGVTAISQTQEFIEGSFNGTAYPANLQNCEVPEPTLIEFQFKVIRN